VPATAPAQDTNAGHVADSEGASDATLQPRGRRTRGYEAFVIAGEGQRAECMDVASHEPGKALSPATASAACTTVAWVQFGDRHDDDDDDDDADDDESAASMRVCEYARVQRVQK